MPVGCRSGASRLLVGRRSGAGWALVYSLWCQPRFQLWKVTTSGVKSRFLSNIEVIFSYRDYRYSSPWYTQVGISIISHMKSYTPRGCSLQKLTAASTYSKRRYFLQKDGATSVQIVREWRSYLVLTSHVVSIQRVKQVSPNKLFWLAFCTMSRGCRASHWSETVTWFLSRDFYRARGHRRLANCSNHVIKVSKQVHTMSCRVILFIVQCRKNFDNAGQQDTKSS